jgi:protein involved in polysaccharide export with SLBB domain
MSDELMAMSQAIRRAAGFGSTPTDEITAARERIEKARASGDAAEIEAAITESDRLIEQIEGTAPPAPDFAAGAGRPVQSPPSMSDAMRAAWRG